MSSIYSSGSGFPAKIFGALAIAGILTVGGLVVKYGGTISVPDGSVSAPSIRSASSTSDGLYFSRPNHVGVTASGTRAVEFTPTSTTIDNSLLVNNITISGTCTGCGAASLSGGSASSVAIWNSATNIQADTGLQFKQTNDIWATNVKTLISTGIVSSTQYFADSGLNTGGNQRGYCFNGQTNATSSCMLFNGSTVSINVAGSPVLQLSQGGSTVVSALSMNNLLNTLGVLPVADALYNVGTSAKRYKDGWFSGSVTSTSLTVGTAGTAMTMSFTTSTSLDFGNSAAAGTQQLTMPAQGATTAGSFCRLQQSTLQARTDETYSCYISSANVASVVRDCAAVAGCGDPAAATVIIKVTD